MDFRSVTGLTIPAGSVNKISIGGVVVWSKKNDGRYKILKDGQLIDRITIADLVSKVQDGSAQTDYGIGAQIVVPYHDPWDNNDYKLPWNFGTFTVYGEGKLGLQTHYAIPTTALVYCERTSEKNSNLDFSKSSIFKWLNSHGTEHNLSVTDYENKTGFLDCLPEDFIDATQTLFHSDELEPKFSALSALAYNVSSVSSVIWEYWLQRINNTTVNMDNMLNTSRSAWKIYCIHDPSTSSAIMTSTRGGRTVNNQYYNYMYSFSDIGKFIFKGGDAPYRYQPYCVIG